MGEHKHNPNCIKAKNGELPPKPPKRSKREVERELYSLVKSKLDEKTGGLVSLLINAPYDGRMTRSER